MFCSRCGKTLKPEWDSCQYCNMPVGESKFEGVPYTSAQQHILPGSNVSYEARAYTRTTYTGGDYEEQYDGEVDVATSYRPVYDYHSAPDEIRDDMMEAVKQNQTDEGETEEDAGYAAQAAEAPAEASQPEEPMPAIDINDIEGFDMSKIKARPIIAKKPAGFSSEVEEYVRKLEMDTGKPPRRGKHIAENDPYKDVVDDEPVQPIEPVDDEEADDEYYDDEPRTLRAGSIVKIVVALVVVAVLFVGGIYIAPKIIDNFKKEAAAPIEGVTVELYNAGIDLLDDHMKSAYIEGIMTTYENGGFIALTTRLTSDKAEISAMLPETPSINDKLFLSAISKIQDDIGGAVTMDAIEKQTTGTVASQESQDRWASIEQSVAAFKTVNSASGLSSIVAGEKIVAVINTPTPEPMTTPAPEYPTLSKGDDNDDVKKLQQRLYDLGYLDDEPDGKFGNNTQTAVKLFQQEADIVVTGVADNATQVAMFADDAPMTEHAKITPVPEPTEEPVQPAEVSGQN